MDNIPDHNGSLPPTQLYDEKATLTFGALLGKCLQSPLVIYLTGNLGAGKTTLVRGMLRSLGYTGNVKSPTYNLLELYVISRLQLYHFDFYRFTSPEEFLDAGMEEYFTTDAVCLVEWPDKAAPYLAPPDMEIRLVVQGTQRVAEAYSFTEAGSQCIKKLLTQRTTPTP